MSIFTQYLESEDFKFLSGKKLMIDDQVILNERALPKGWFNLATYEASINYFLSKIFKGILNFPMFCKEAVIKKVNLPSFEDTNRIVGGKSFAGCCTDIFHSSGNFRTKEP